MIAYFDMRIEIGKVIPIKNFVNNPFYLKGLDYEKNMPEYDLPNFTIYFSNNRQKLLNTISGKQLNENEVTQIKFKGGGRPTNLFLPDSEKCWPVYNYCYLAVDRLTETHNVYLLFEIKLE